MKKYIVIVLILTLFLCGCSNNDEATELYSMYAITLNGEECDFHTYYPNGLQIQKNEEAYWTLINGDTRVKVNVDNDVVVINELQAAIKDDKNGFSLTMENTGLIYYFTNLDNPVSVLELTNHTPIQIKYSGEYEGRIYFTNTEGKWLEYEGRSLNISGSLYVNDEGTGELKLYSDIYSESIPIADLYINFNGDKIIASEGTVLEYQLSEGYFEVEYLEKLVDEINSMAFINPYEYSWYVPEKDEEIEQEYKSVFDISGECMGKNESLYFNIEIYKNM